MQLNDIQDKFKTTMLNHPDAVENPDEQFAKLFNEGDIPLPARLKVYRNNIVGGLTDNVMTIFPVLEKLVGKEFLEVMIRTYILANPPQHGCLSTYGSDLAEFIEEFEAAKALPYLPDVARLEIKTNKSYYAQNDEPLSAEDLAQIDPEQLENTKLSLRHSVELLFSKFPLEAIKEFCLKDSRADDEQLDLNQGAVHLMIYRPQLDVETLSLEPDEFLFLQNLEQEHPLGKALENTLQNYEDFDVQAFLQKHIALETFRKP